MKPWNYFILLFIPGLVVAGYMLGGWWNFLVPVCCFLIYPIMNFLIAPPKNENLHKTSNYSSKSYSYVALAFVPVLLVLTFWSVYVSGTASISTVAFTGLTLSVGIVNGVLGFTLAHEFIHRFSKIENTAGYLLLLQNNYMHYGIEHVRGHHVYACTPEDPHTASKGEPLYMYLLRAIRGTYVNACKLEAKKLSREHPLNSFMHNRIIVFGLLQITLVISIYFILGSKSLSFFLLQGLIAIGLLHTINYLQHYGLFRVKNINGTYEKINEQHAWNSKRYNSFINLFELESHADHHMHPSHTFDKLATCRNSPSHPAGYSFMIFLSLVPPLWFRIMDKIIDEKN